MCTYWDLQNHGFQGEANPGLPAKELFKPDVVLHFKERAQEYCVQNICMYE